MSRRWLGALLGAGLALAPAAAWWLRPVPQLLRAQPSLRPAAAAPSVRTGLHSSAALARAADELAEPQDGAAQAPLAARLVEDRSLGQPVSLPTRTASDPRPPDAPPPLPLDADEIAPDDPHDFALPGRAPHER